MPVDRKKQAQTINAQDSQGFLNNPSGPVTQHFGNNVYITIDPNASVDQVIEAARTGGLLARLTTQLPEERFHQLLTIMSQVTLRDAGEHLYRVCRASLPPTASIKNTNIAPILLADMAEQRWVNAWPPLLECVERFSRVNGVAEAQSTQLQAWVDDAARALRTPVPAAEVVRLRKSLQAETSNDAGSQFSWLQVYLEPDWLNRTQDRKQPLFRVELVLWSPATKGGHVLSTATADQANPVSPLWALDDLPALLDTVFADRENVALIPNMTRVVIEVVAPSEVLLYAFERWKRNKSARTYGIEHPIVVRLADRLAIPDAADQARADAYWREKWTAFRACAHDQACTLLAWRCADDLDAIDLQDDADLFGVAVASPLLADRRDVFEILRDAGVPIALCVRGTDPQTVLPADWVEQLTALIQDTPMANLHEGVQQIRRLKHVRTDTTHFGNALMLLWDDPERPPLKYQQQGAYK
jgi:hypothetical protein